MVDDAPPLDITVSTTRMKSPDVPTLPSFERSDAEAALEQARRAADPDYYVQNATGRALTKVLAIVIGLQLGGVFLWLLLVFVGVMDATGNLDEFLISQLVVFLLSVFTGIGWSIRYVRGLKEEAKKLEPGLMRPILKGFDAGVDVDTDDNELPSEVVDGDDVGEIANALEVRWSAAGTIGDTPYQLWELASPEVDGDGDEEEPALLFVARGCAEDGGEKRVVRLRDGVDDDTLDSSANSRLNAALQTLESVVEDTRGACSLIVEDGRVVLTLRHNTLLDDDEAAVDDVHCTGRQVAAALEVLAATSHR